MLLDAIAAAVSGGASLFGEHQRVWSALLGALPDDGAVGITFGLKLLVIPWAR
jgi:ABC-type xylose transport system permease subunit